MSGAATCVNVNRDLFAASLSAIVAGLAVFLAEELYETGVVALGIRSGERLEPDGTREYPARVATSTR
jgi:hypothetical protein